jgi:hypothetical protein
MNVREMLKIQQAFENKTIPEDLLNDDIVYWSKSKKEHIKMLDLDLHHLLRIMINYLEEDRYLIESQSKLDITVSLGKILNEIGKIQDNINDKT